MRCFLILPILLMLCACQPNNGIGVATVAYPAALPIWADQPLGDVPQLVEALRAQGARVEPIGRADLAFLAVEGQMYELEGERIQVYAYPAAAAAAADAARFSPDGAQISTDAGALLVNWVATPNLYRAGRLLVIYLGDHEGTLRHLERVVGRRFAGGANPYQVSVQAGLSETR